MTKPVSFDLIHIEQDLPGFAPFFGAWLCEGPLNLVIDVGPARTAGRVIASLRSHGLARLDYVLLTHVHIDHCGALAALLEAYPSAKVICHAAGLPFLVNPEKLWKGSLAVLGELAEAYGAPERIRPEKLIAHPEAAIEGLTIAETPGHALHHLSYVYGGRLFAGEAAGNYFRISGRDYLRPATPPRFFLDVCLRSVDALLAFEDQPICYAHCGWNEHSHPWLTAFRDQLLLWAEIIQAELRRGDRDVLDRCVRALLANDSNLGAFEDMDPPTQARERTFIANAVKGFLGYLSSDVKL